VVDLVRAEDEEYREANEREERWTRAGRDRPARRERPQQPPARGPSSTSLPVHGKRGQNAWRGEPMEVSTLDLERRYDTRRR
jgi:hypothetical protein